MNIQYVKFNRFPEIEIRAIHLEDKERIILSKDGECRTVEEDKQLFPFELKNDVIVTVFLKSGSKFSFKIAEKYRWNGADIPRIFWAIVGSQYNPDVLVPSCLHDYLLEHKTELMKQTGMNTDDFRSLTSDIFHELLLQNGVGKLKAKIMAGAVQFYQKYFNKRGWK